MTTAARPTFDPAKGGSSLQDTEKGKLSHLVSARDQPAHLKLKERVPGQGTKEEISQRDLKAELEEREKIAQIEKSKEPQYRFVPSLEQAAQLRLAVKAGQDRERADKKDKLLNGELISEDEPVQTCPAIVNARKMAQLDKDEDFGSENELSISDFTGIDDDIDEDEDPDELFAELVRLREEREAEEERRKQEMREKEETVRPDMSESASANFEIKRRWDDDVPFKNCARDGPDSKRGLYVNDTLRQEFHKKFMDKYIR